MNISIHAKKIVKHNLAHLSIKKLADILCLEDFEVGVAMSEAIPLLESMQKWRDGKFVLNYSGYADDANQASASISANFFIANMTEQK